MGDHLGAVPSIGAGGGGDGQQQMFTIRKQLRPIDGFTRRVSKILAAAPPPDGTRKTPLALARRIESSAVQLAPKLPPDSLSATVIGTPPSMGTFLSPPYAALVNATHRPSGEKVGVVGARFCVPAIGLASAASRDRRYSCPLDTNTICVPSGEMASTCRPVLLSTVPAGRANASRTGRSEAWIDARAPSQNCEDDKDTDGEQGQRARPRAPTRSAAHQLRRGGSHRTRFAQPLQLCSQVACALTAVLGILRETLADDALEERRRQRLCDGHRRRVDVHDRGNETGLALFLERLPAREQLVEHGAAREEVRAHVALAAVEHLRGHVLKLYRRACPARSVRTVVGAGRGSVAARSVPRVWPARSRAA